MEIEFRTASIEDAGAVGSLVLALTNEISELMKEKQFSIDLSDTIRRCSELIETGKYAAILGFSDGVPVAVVTLSETYALYASGKVGIIQEFYVVPALRSTGLGSKLIKQVRDYGIKNKWSCIELCTPPLPEFDRTLAFYKKNELNPVGGRKMRQILVEA